VQSAKDCRICGKTKPVDDYQRRKGSPDGLRTECRECNHAQQKANRERRRDELAALHRERYAKNRERVIEERREFRAREAARINEERRRKRAVSPERYRAMQRAYYAANREVIIERVKARNFRRRWVDLEELIARDGLLCGICGDFLDPGLADVDHVHPKSLGGSNDLSNLQLAHVTCNRSKQAKVR
jgi:5-methylcytosine-specific restriction endonuclease McrA